MSNNYVKLTNILDDYDVDELVETENCNDVKEFFTERGNKTCTNIRAGSYGVPILVVDKKTHKKYIIKKIFELRFDDIERELNIRHLNHPNIPKYIATYYNIFKDGEFIPQKEKEISLETFGASLLFNQEGTLFIVMEFVEGETLYDRKKNINYTSLLKDLISVLKYIHLKKKMVHLDLSRANIMIDNNNKPYVIDFGTSVTDDDIKYEKIRFRNTPTISKIIRDPKNPNISKTINIPKDPNKFLFLGDVIANSPHVLKLMKNNIQVSIEDLMFNDIYNVFVSLFTLIDDMPPYHFATDKHGYDLEKTRYIILNTYPYLLTLKNRLNKLINCMILYARQTELRNFTLKEIRKIYKMLEKTLN